MKMTMMRDFSVQYTLIVVLYVKCLIGFTVNMIMVATNVMKWKIRKSLPTSDKILSHLAISRGLYFVNIFIQISGVHFELWPRQKQFVPSILYILSMFLYYVSQWIATTLCVFYCVKIVSYNCALCLFLKSRISTMVPWLVTASLIMSFISSLPFGWYRNHLKTHKIFNTSSENNTNYGHDTTLDLMGQFLIFAAGSFPPFIIFCAANFLLICFLFMHTQRMKSNGSHVHNPNLKSHFGALKSMSLFLVLQILLFIGMNLFASGKFLQFQYPMLISWMVRCSPPLLHSIYLISASDDVRKVFTSMCSGLMRCF
ncbi:hypothetical protein GDO81_028876 [Engystomops pustulosus]|uniref:Taste receptor type 2 n=1 Tax=Engystomops pustulosus TaxID=76066 RepID=A0AAV6ZLG0_ENGPU|nr:hypothetical protein GDO81_028876 [Engystomops pustulosus]